MNLQTYVKKKKSDAKKHMLYEGRANLMCMVSNQCGGDSRKPSGKGNQGTLGLMKVL